MTKQQILKAASELTDDQLKIFVGTMGLHYRLTSIKTKNISLFMHIINQEYHKRNIDWLDETKSTCEAVAMELVAHGSCDHRWFRSTMAYDAIDAVMLKQGTKSTSSEYKPEWQWFFDGHQYDMSKDEFKLNTREVMEFTLLTLMMKEQ